MKAMRVPISISPSTTSQPPTPSTIAVATDERMSTAGKYTLLRTTVS